MPGYLEARGAAGHVVPRVEVTFPQSGEEDQEEVQEAGANGKRKATGEARGRPQVAGGRRGRRELNAVLTYVVKALNQHLLTELLDGFPS
jgi:hypothetical protein